MTVELSTPTVTALADVVAVLREWQQDDSAIQLHPGDVGWFWNSGPDNTAASLRVWSQDGRILAVGLEDSSDLVRMAFAPATLDDRAVNERIAVDVADPARGVLPAGEVFLEARGNVVLAELLTAQGWELDDPWAQLRRDLSEPVEASGLRVELVDADRVAERVAVQRASFEGSTFTDERWRHMEAGLPYADARCIIGHDDAGDAVAAATVWSAGPGRPGVIEPLGVHRDHRGRGHGRAISRAAAAELREMGSSAALVASPVSNVAAVTTYEAAGFRRDADARDLRRPA